MSISRNVRVFTSNILPSSNFSRQATWIACLLCVMFAAPLLRAQPRGHLPEAPYAQKTPDQEEGRSILTEFRGKGISGEFFLEFSLRVMPRRGDEVVIPGRMWGGRNSRGPLSRIAVKPAIAGHGGETRLLVQGGAAPQAWVWKQEQAGESRMLESGALFDRIADTDLTAFDLQMQFLYWDDFIFEGVKRLKSRPAHVFLLRPPPEIVARQPALKSMRVYLDTQFGALVQAEQLGEGERVLKVMTVVELKKIGDQWIVKSIDLRDETTRNKTRFQITGAALSQNFLPRVFEPGSLSETLQPPSGGSVISID